VLPCGPMPPLADPAVEALERTMEHEAVANEVKHWVRLTAACNSKCVFCLDAEAQDGRILPFADICVEIDRGRAEKGATRIVLSGGEASLHPRFADCVRYAKEAGYRWVQTVTNGVRYADRTFFEAAVDAGLDEMTFSLHGHTAALHDRLTRTKDGFDRLMKAMIRAQRSGRVVVNVDVCINRENVRHLEAIVAMCARVGVKEFDLLHIIPQGVAFENRDTLFYDVDAHAEDLRKVFRLARRPDFHIWTNRFPLSHLEDMEELIQDPHKMLDEVGGRRVQFRRYLDGGAPIDCRDAARCPHCFIEPFCSALDRHVTAVVEQRFEVWWVGTRVDLAPPPGVRWIGVEGVVPAGQAPLYFVATDDATVPLPPGSRRVLSSVAHLEASSWGGGGGPPATPPRDSVEVHLSAEVCAWLLAHPVPPDVIFHVPTRATMAEAALDPDWAAFFTAYGACRAQNLPACEAPGVTLERPLRVLDAGLFHDDGRLAIDGFVDHYIRDTYRAKSLRCRACPADAWCQGGHVQSIRAHGFRRLRPERVTAEMAERVAALYPGEPRLRDGAPPVAPAPRVAVPGNAPVPFVDTAPGRRS
jgi:MoaA/NifB/PqqE/SkfB family radical SAM enzyme